MDFLNVKGEQYIKVVSVIDLLNNLESETTKSEETPKLVKEIISNMMITLIDIFSSASGSEKETLKTEEINVIENPDIDIVRKN